MFDTTPIPEQDRYDLWRGADVARLSTRYETTPSEPFEARMEWLDLGTLGIGRAIVSAATWDRSRRNVLRDDNDDLVISVRHAGAAVFDVSGCGQNAPTGSIVLVDMSAPRAHLSDASVTTGFSLPRVLAERTLPPVRSLHGHVIAPEHAALLESHLTALYRHANALPASSGPAIAQTIIDLLAVALAASMATSVSDPAQRERALLVQLRSAIEEQLGSPSLTTARLSRSLGVSRSTLYRLLQDEGGVQAYIRTRRLARVADTLARTGSQGETIAALAERWGFCDAAYLGRAFREAYGVTPGDYRAQHGGIGTGIGR